MAHKVSEVIAGSVVLLVAIGFVVYGSKVSGFGSGGSTYDLRASFRSVEGVSVGTDVRMSGVKMGTVTALRLDPQTFRADATFTMPAGVELPDDSSLRIASEGLLGGNFVEVLPGGSLTNYQPGAEITDTQGSVSLIDLMVKFATGGGGSSADTASPDPTAGQ
jgi:phospholipid/cholesterol/gamma-HCH transport system substrate-binding protein